MIHRSPPAWPWARWLVSSVLVLLSGCSDSPEPSVPDADAGPEVPARGVDVDPQFELFPHSELLEVSIELDPSDWEQLKSEGLSINETFSNCDSGGFDYTKFSAVVRLGDHTFDKVSVRKKGYLGSISRYRPSLRIDLDAFLADQAIGGTKAITLNNSQSDKSYAAQCVSYEQFAAAGIPAPRCGFAHVTVNGESLGVYVSVEPIKKPFLREHYGDDQGDLYEGAGGADFRADMLVGFEKKTNEEAGPGPELKALADALTLPDAELVPALEALIDLDEFLRFWATESLVAHWDGYAGDLNNFFVYVDPSSGKLRFIPWGTDNAFEGRHPFLPNDTWPRSALAWARLPRRLYAHPETRERYRDTLRKLLAEHWDESKMVAEIDAIAALSAESSTSGAVELLKTFIRGRRAVIQAELDVDAKPWTIPERSVATCREDANTPITISFRTSWGDLSATSALVGNSVTATIQGQPLTPVYVLASAGESLDPNAPGKALRITVGNPDGSFTLFQFMLGAPSLAPGDLPLHGFETYGIVLRGRLDGGGMPGALQTLGFVGRGRIIFEAAGTQAGDAVTGRIEADLVSAAPNPLTMP